MSGLGQIRNPYLLDGVRLPARVCRVLEAKLGPELARLRTQARGVDPEVAHVLMALRETAMSFVPPEEQRVGESEEQAAVSEWMSTKDAADLLGLGGSRAVVQAIARGRFPAEMVGRVYRVRREDVENCRARRVA